MKKESKIALGGGCHWCTEAVYQSLRGVAKVEQGFVAADGAQATWSEAVIVHYDATLISLKDLVNVHLYTHKSTVSHSMREKYRSAVYFFDSEDQQKIGVILEELQSDFKAPLVTQILPFKNFKPSEEQFHDYYYSNPKKPFCSNYISPKLKLLLERFSTLVNSEKLKA